MWAGGLASANPSHPSHGGGPRPTIVLVHGDWADGSSWNGVTERLQRRGFTVVAPPNPLRGPSNPPYPGYAACFANGVDRKQAALLEAAQRPAAVDQFGEPSGPPAWETIPSWSLIGTADGVITPAQQRAMSTNAGAQISTVNAGHLSLVTRPNTVTNVIETAVDATT